MPGGGLTLFRVRGIRISVDYSWFIVLFLIIFWLSGSYRDVLGAGRTTSVPTPWRSPALLFAHRSCFTSSDTPTSRSVTGSGSPG